MPRNFNSSQVGVPYERTARIVIDYPDGNQVPTVAVEKMEAVKLADNTTRRLGTLTPLYFSADLTQHGDDAIPLIHPVTGEAIPGQFTNLSQAFMVLLAIIRFNEPAEEA